MTLPELLAILASMPEYDGVVDFDQAGLVVVLEYAEDGGSLCQLRVSVSHGRWNVSTIGFGLGLDFTLSGPEDDHEGFRAALAKVGRHNGQPGRLRLVKGRKGAAS